VVPGCGRRTPGFQSSFFRTLEFLNGEKIIVDGIRVSNLARNDFFAVFLRASPSADFGTNVLDLVVSGPSVLSRCYLARPLENTGNFLHGRQIGLFGWNSFLFRGPTDSFVHERES